MIKLDVAGVKEATEKKIAEGKESVKKAEKA